ncbi:MAG: hypothetical protein PWQ14_423 [Rikenellaceae bacterium]|nr:hypothetical protein [Rikenellaceae bacterium]
MRKFILILLIFIFLIFASIQKLYSQKLNYIEGGVLNITLYVIPFTTLFNYNLPYKAVKKISSMKIIIWESNCKLTNYEFLDLVKNLNLEYESKISEDYRIKCVINKIFGREVLYFNQFGDFLYKGKTYHNEEIKNFIWKHLPKNCN